MVQCNESGGRSFVCVLRVCRPAAGGPVERPVSLQEEALKRVIADYETQMAQEVEYPHTQERTTLRRCVELQVRQIARVLRGEQREYQPFLSEGQA